MQLALRGRVDNGKSQKGKKNKKQPKPRRDRYATRARGDRILAQGVGRVPRGGVVFAGRTAEKYSLACWNATLPAHLPLPRAVGPYLVVRSTRRIKTSATNIVFGFFRTSSGLNNQDAARWTDLCAIEDINGGLPINGVGNAFRVQNQFALTAVAGTTALSCAPAAMTVQCLNPEALQTTTGIVYMGVMHTQADISGRTESWNDYFDRFVRFQGPRLMSAAKLALRGVMCNSYPLSMPQVSEFTHLDQIADGSFQWNGTELHPVGYAPIMLFNPDGVELEYLVTQEWRVRFDLSNPASAAHVHHPIASDWTWDSLMKKATAMGHGVRDIVEAIADGAAAVQGASRLMALGN